MTPLYVSFFTDKYRDSAAELVKSLDRFGLEHDLVDCSRNGNDWMKNVQFKPRFILNMMELHPGRPLVWLDADARVRKQPKMFDEWACASHPDFAAHWLAGSELLSGTLWFGATPAAKRLARLWLDEQHASPEQVDQVVLERVVGRHPEMNIKRMPAAYVAIFDHEMCSEKDWVISHHQYSRRYRFAS